LACYDAREQVWQENVGIPISYVRSTDNIIGSRQVNKMLEPNTWYEINDQELFLFATAGFWDREEKMEVYRRVKARKIEKQQAGEP
jgi:hypothetical protein